MYVLHGLAGKFDFTLIYVYYIFYTVLRVLMTRDYTREAIMLIHSPADLAQYYRDQRKKLGLSQASVADEVAVRQDTVSKFEIKADNARLETLFRLLSALDMEMHIVPKGQSISGGNDKKGWTEQW